MTRALLCLALLTLTGCAHVERFTHQHPVATNFIIVSVALSGTAAMVHNQISMGHHDVTTGPADVCKVDPNACK